VVKIKIINTQTNHDNLSPISRAYRGNTAWGSISPKTKISAVATIPAITPEVILPKKIAMTVYEATFPSNSVHNKRLPFFLILYTFSA